MADNFAGMFRDPRSYRDERLNQLMQDRMAISGMGGSMNQLLGQVAAGGGATGAMMAEGLGGMFGLQTREEAQAQQLQDMASQVSMEDPDALAAFAKQLNEMGMTKEAVMVLDKRQSVLNQKAKDDAAEREKLKFAREMGRPITETYYVNVPARDSKGQPILKEDGTPVMVQERRERNLYWNKEAGRFLPREGSSTSNGSQGNGGGIFENEEEMFKTLLQPTQPEEKPVLSDEEAAKVIEKLPVSDEEKAAMRPAYEEYVYQMRALGIDPVSFGEWVYSQAGTKRVPKPRPEGKTRKEIIGY